MTTDYERGVALDDIKRGETQALASHAQTPSTGSKLDGGKAQFHLLPWEAVREVVKVLEFGARKYAPGNWRLVPNATERYGDAAIRHLAAWQGGERCDPESGLHHLAHAGCCVLFALAFEVAT